MAEKDADLGTKNDALLKRIRERYRYAMDKWRRNRTEGQKNMRYVSGDPWDDEDRNARKGRPTVCADQLNQFVNQVVNTARQNPRGIINRGISRISRESHPGYRIWLQRIAGVHQRPASRG